MINTWDYYLNKYGRKNDSSNIIPDSIWSDNAYELGGLSGSMIDQIMWNQGYGGTLQLGGLNNNNGVLTLKDANSVEKVRMDKDGITVKDANGTTIIDGSGLVSTANFASNVASIGSQSTYVQSITSADTYTDITDGSTPASLSITVARSTKIFLSGRVNCGISFSSGTAGAAMGYIGLYIGNTLQDEALFFADITSSDKYGYANTCIPTDVSYIATLSAGTHTIKLKGKYNNNLNVSGLDIYGYRLNYFVLGT